MVYIRSILFLSFCFIHLFAYSQTGPGGVGDNTSNVVWFRADAEVYNDAGTTPASDGETVQQWNDQSGNANNASQGSSGNRPEYKTGILNSKPVLRFDGTDDKLVLTSPASNNFTLFSISKTTVTHEVDAESTSGVGGVSGQRYLFGAQHGGASNGGSGLSLGTNGISVYEHGSSYMPSLAVYNASVGTSYNSITIRYSSKRPYIYLNGSLVRTGLTSPRSNVTATRELGGGSYGFHDGDLAEVIVYNYSLNNAELRIVENYLSSKYNLNTTNDYYSYDTEHNEDVAGIGRVDGSNTHTAAYSSDLIQISGASGLGDDEFLLTGHNDGSVAAWTTTEAPNSGDNIQRITREWRLDETGDVGTVTFTIESANLPALPVDYTMYVLLLDDDGDFSSGASIYELEQVGATTEYDIDGLDITDGGYMSIGAVKPVVEFSSTTDNSIEPATGPTDPTFTISLNFIPVSSVTVDYYTTDGTADSPDDFTEITAGSPSTATFTAGNMTTTGTFTVASDAVLETDETLTITLTNPSGGVNLGTTSSLTYTINDEDNPRKIYFNAASSNADEGDGSATIQVDISISDASFPTSATYTVTGGTATGGGTDYTLAVGVINIPAGSTDNTFTINITDDAIDEANETVEITLINPVNCNLSGTNPITHTFTINDDDPEPEIQFSYASSNGDESTLLPDITVELSGTSAQDVSVDYTVGGTASGGGTDYTLGAGTVTITAGNTTGTIIPLINNDTDVEEIETIIITLTDPPTNATMGSNDVHTYSIIDDDNLGYLGPGGVGSSSSMGIWLRADHGVYNDAGSTLASNGDNVQEWHDYWGSNNASQTTAGNRPNYYTGIINGLPVIRFNGSSDLMTIASTANDNFSVFGVYQTGVTHQIDGESTSGTGGTSGQRYLYGAAHGGASNGGFGVSIGTNGISVYEHGSGYMPALAVYNGSVGSGYNTVGVIYTSQQPKIYYRGSVVRTGQTSPRALSTLTTQIGGGSYGYLNGDIAEMFTYNSSINSAQQIIVDNYLAAKFGTTLTSEDKYAFEAGHGYEVAGIGREDASNIHYDAQGTSMVRIFNADDLDQNNEYLLWGHDNAAFNLNTGDVPGGSDNRLNRVWRVDESGGDGVGTVTLNFDVSDFFIGDDTELELLIDADGTFSAGAVSHTTGLSYNSTTQTVTFTDVDFSDGDYFTICSKTSDNIFGGILYARVDGDWNSGSSWSYEGPGGASCTCIPGATSSVIIDGYTINMNTSGNVQNLTITDDGELIWTANSVTLAVNNGGRVLIQSGGLMDGDSHTNAYFGFQTGAFTYELEVNGTGTALDVSDFWIMDDATVNVTGTGDINIYNNMQFAGDDAVLNNNSTGTISITDRLTFGAGDRDNVLTNNGTISIGDGIRFRDNDNTIINNGTISLDRIFLDGGTSGNVLTNSAGATINLSGDFDLNDDGFTLNNSGTFNHDGDYLNCGGAEAFNNLSGGTYRWSGTTVDADADFYLNNGNSIFYYDGAAQPVIIPQDNYWNLNISGGTKSLGSSVDVYGDLTIASSGILQWSAASVDLTMYNSGNLTIESGGSIDYNTQSDAELCFAAGETYALVVNGTGTVIDIYDLRIYASSTLNITGAGDIDIADKLMFSDDNSTINNISTGTVTVSNKVVFQNGDDNNTLLNSGTIDVTNQFHFRSDNCIINNSGSISCGSIEVDVAADDNNQIVNQLGATLSITGNINIGDADFDMNNSGTVDHDGDFVDCGGTDEFNNLNNGSWYWSGTAADAGLTINCSSNGNTFVYNRSGAQNILDPADGSYWHIGFAGSGDKVTQSNMDVNGNLTVSGTANLDAATNSNDINIAGNWSDDGTFDEGDETVTFDGATGQSVSTSETFYNLVIANNSNTVSLSDDVTISNQLDFTTSGYIDINGNDLIITDWDDGDIVTLDIDRFVIVDNTGFLKVTGVDAGETVNFPVGLATGSTNYARVDIENNDGANTDFDVQLCDAVYDDGTCDGGGGGSEETTDIIDLNWNIVSSSTDANVWLYWDVSKEMPGFDRTDMAIVHYTGGTWVQCGGPGPATNLSGTIYYKIAPTTGFSRFTGILRGSALPVELLDFDCELINDIVEIKWVTATETDNDYFTVERSTDALNFEKVIQVPGAGNSTSVNEYFAIDHEPYTGISYYRLKQTDYNGNYDYSHIVTVENYQSEDVIEFEGIFNVYPNPAKTGDNFYVDLKQRDPYEKILIVVRTIYGELLYSKVIITDSGGEVIEAIDMNKRLASGIYMVIGTSKDKYYSKKLIVR